jgi:hypothetical protein
MRGPELPVVGDSGASAREYNHNERVFQLMPKTIDNDVFVATLRIAEAATQAGGTSALNYPDKVAELIEIVAKKLQDLKDRA